MLYIHRTEYYSALKRKEILTHATTWINFEDIMLSEVSQSQKDKYSMIHLKEVPRASLVAQWLRIRLPMQGTRVQALVREDPTCRGATKPVRHNY